MAKLTTGCGYLALMRGLNVGGNNKLPMKDLAALFAEVGCKDVRTYIQSGNVIFNAGRAAVRGLPDGIAQRMEDRFGFRSPVILRTAKELGDAIRNNPYIGAGVSETTLHVYFLANEPNAQQIEALDPNRCPPDAFTVRGREVYMQLPDGMARTKLTNAYFDSKLKTVSSARNWNTVCKLYELMRG